MVLISEVINQSFNKIKVKEKLELFTLEYSISKSSLPVNWEEVQIKVKPIMKTVSGLL